jgi:hypothetical protein
MKHRRRRTETTNNGDVIPDTNMPGLPKKMELLSRPISTAAGGTDPTQAYENEPFASKNNKGKFHATSGLQRHFGRGSGRSGERRGYIHVLWEPTLPR